MNLTLSSEIEQRIAEEVRLGRYSSVEALVEAAVSEFVDRVAPVLDVEDLAAIAEADAEIDRGEGIGIAELRRQVSERYSRS